MSHTPGPWIIHPSWKTVVVRAEDAQKPIGFASDPERHARVFARSICDAKIGEFEVNHGIASAGEDIANARLIAAAPDLLEALRSLADAGDDIADMASYFILAGDPKGLRNYGTNIANIARYAIAKATGEAVPA